MTDLSAAFGKPFSYQVAAFRLRLAQLQPTLNWKDVWQAEHDRAFMVAGAQKTELLADFFAAIDKAVVKGTTLEEFRQDFARAVEEHNWHGWTGETTEKGRAWRTRVIYRTNLATSFAAGRHAQLQAENLPFWIYFHGNSREPRLQHLGWNGLILPSDHPFWSTHFPPNGWGCSCRVTGARSMREAVRLGGNPAVTLPDGWAVRDPKTLAPPGIDKGWAYAPGATTSGTVQALASKAVDWDYSLAIAFMRDLPASTRDEFARAYRRQPSLADALKRLFGDVGASGEAGTFEAMRSRHLTMGPATTDDMGRLEALTGRNLGPSLYDFTLDATTVKHVIARHTDAAIEASRNQWVVTAEDMSRLPEVLLSPDSVVKGDRVPGRNDILVFTKTFGTRRIVVHFEILTKRRRLSLVTMRVEKNVDASPTATS